jgi:hypothetical protein
MKKEGRNFLFVREENLILQMHAVQHHDFLIP